MIPLSLTLTGFKGIRDGLGRETISINFADLTQGAELVAITGRNGRGKSTILDNMTPYPVMPSKAGLDGLGAFSYYEEVYLPENFKELTWELDGLLYRSQLVIRDQGKRKTEAYLHEHRAGRWQPVSLPDGTLSDGRMETYLKCVEGIAGSCATFLTTAFSAQNRRQIATYRNAEIKSLLADLLGLEKIQALGGKAQETLRLLRAGLVSLRQSRSALQTEYDSVTASLEAQGDTDRLVAIARQNKAIAAERRESCRTELAALTAQHDMHSAHRARREQLEQDRQGLLRNAETARAQLEKQEAGLHAALTRLRQRASQREAQRETSIASLRSQITSLKRTLHNGRHVERAVRRLVRLEPVYDLRKRKVEQLQQDTLRYEQLKAQAALKQEQLTAIDREVGQAILAEQDLRRRFGLTAEVPCAGMAMQQHCKLLGDARAAQPLIPSAAATIDRLDLASRNLKSELHRIDAALADGIGIASALTNAKAKRCRTEARLSWEQQLAARLRDISAARENLASVETQLAETLTSKPVADCDYQIEMADVQSQLDDLVHRRSELSETLRSNLVRIDDRLAQLPPLFDDAALARAVTAAAQVNAFLESADKALETALAAAERRNALSHRLADCEARMSDADRRIAHVEQHVARWSLFAKCMGNDGIIALAIDDAGPELSCRANELLMACYGPRFTVSIKTQLENAKGDLREGFEVTVHDAWRNTSKNVGKMSGGERIWINECLTRAMALYLAEASARRSSTLFSDEADGAFDAQHKRQFMAMKREVLRIGGYRQEYFISHTPELSEMADAVIDLDQYAVDAALASPQAEH